MRRIACLLLWVLTSALSAGAQSPETTKSEQPAGTGAITGRVLDETGQPVFNAEVRASESGGFDTGATAATDEDGKFRLDGLTPRAYSLSVLAPGFVLESQGRAGGALHYLGDVVSLRVRKGAVITGKVARADGEPVIAVRITVTMVRDEEGARVTDDDSWESTDDRGIYRVFGLREGTYIVSAGGDARQFFRMAASFLSEDAPTYYPSSTLEDAGEVSVRSGQEVSGIDITYRGDRGHKASGTVVGTLDDSVWVSVRSAAHSVEVGSTAVDRAGGTFEFDALADGEYELTATRFGDRQTQSFAGPVKFKVRGADVTGLRLVLAPVASLAGKVVLEGLPAPDAQAPCPEKSSRVLTEIVVVLDRDAPDGNDGSGRSSSALVAKDGAFTEMGLRPAKIHLSARLPDDGWYVRSITRTEAGKKAPVDVARDGLAVSAGQAVEGVVVTVSAGAAGVAGRIVPAAEGQAVPDGVRVHLVPAEADAGDAVVRFYEVKAERDGTFEIRNVAPGAYRALAVEDKAAADATAVRPAAWDAATRAALRKAAAALPELQLAPCAREKTLELTTQSRPR